MSDTTTDPVELVRSPLTGTAAFKRKIDVRQYEPAEAFISVQFDIPVDGTAEQNAEQTIRNAKDAFFQAKTVVFEELGIAFDLGEDGVLREKIERTLGTVTEVTGTPEAATSAAPVQATVGPDIPSDKAEQREWAKARFASHPGEFYDNREKKAKGEYKPKAPDLKHKASGTGIWLS